MSFFYPGVHYLHTSHCPQHTAHRTLHTAHCIIISDNSDHPGQFQVLLAIHYLQLYILHYVMYSTRIDVLLHQPLCVIHIKQTLCKEKFRIVCNCGIQHASQNKTSIMGLCGPDDQNDQRYYTLSSVTCAVCSVLCAMCSVKCVECAVGYIVHTKGK